MVEHSCWSRAPRRLLSVLNQLVDWHFAIRLLPRIFRTECQRKLFLSMTFETAIKDKKLNQAPIQTADNIRDSNKRQPSDYAAPFSGTTFIGDGEMIPRRRVAHAVIASRISSEYRC